MTDIHDLVAQLNVMLQADPIAITALFEYRVACSRALANTSCVVGTIDHDDYFVTGVLGVLNGLVGGDLRIASEWDGPYLRRFIVVPASTSEVIS